MREKIYYNVGDHLFSLTLDCELRKELKLSAFDPFKVEPTADTLFDVEVVDSIDEPIIEPVIVDAPLSSSGMPKVDIFKVQDGFQYNITMPRCSEVNAIAVINHAEHTCRVAINGGLFSRLTSLNNALILSYVTFTMRHSTLLLHSSTVLLDGRAYLFLGKSGTGKSTHSRMWLESFPEAELLNDDHPIVRVFDDGNVTVYGSPWSGKTPCYRNLSAPIGAIVRIERALSNSAERLRPLKAYASITTSCSGAQWSQELMDDKVKAVESVVKGSKGYVMRCLPNNDAARVCYEFIKNDK